MSKDKKRRKLKINFRRADVTMHIGYKVNLQNSYQKQKEVYL